MILAFLFPTFVNTSIDGRHDEGLSVPTFAFYSYENSILELTIVAHKEGVDETSILNKNRVSRGLDEPLLNRYFALDNVIKATEDKSTFKSSAYFFKGDFVGSRYILEDYLMNRTNLTLNDSLKDLWKNHIGLKLRTLQKINKITTYEEFVDIIESDKLTDLDYDQLENYAKYYAEKFLSSNKDKLVAIMN